MKVAIAGGVRTSFARFNGVFAGLPAYELGRVALTEAMFRTGVKPSDLDEVIFGCVAGPYNAPNISRVISLLSGVPDKVPAFTVSRNCASGMEAVADACYRVASGSAGLIAAGGTESMSSVPLLFSASSQRKFASLGSAKGVTEKLRRAISFRPRDFKPLPGLLLGLKDKVAGMGMGETAELLAKEFDITRQEQDNFALSSHRRASAACRSGRLLSEIAPIPVPPGYSTWAKEDDGIRHEQSPEALSKLRPAFDRAGGTVTPGNSSQITDGASCLIVGNPERLKELGLPVMAFIRAVKVVGLDPARMGLGPALAIPHLLKDAGLKLHDVDLFEINEAFAAQYIACERALCSKSWCQANLGIDPPGAPDRERTNVNGGAIAIGHPVGATGNRLILTACIEMEIRRLKTAVVSLCVGGGQGAALLLERGG